MLACGCTHGAVESAGDYWKPVVNILEGTSEVLSVNAEYVKAVPGRKTDVNDAALLAELLPRGWLRASVSPPETLRELRDLTGYHSTFIRERMMLINRVQKLLEETNITLAVVASDLMGGAGRAMNAALLSGHTHHQTVTDLAKALDGRVKPDHRVVWTGLWYQINSLDDTMALFDTQL
jgi:transposase